jgi:hypothetical protein
VQHTDGTYRCGTSTARVSGDTVHVLGSDEDLDSWRAACAAWWAAVPEAPTATAPKLEWLSH